MRQAGPPKPYTGVSEIYGNAGSREAEAAPAGAGRAARPPPPGRRGESGVSA